ncbi:diadenylate cyclase CdaA [Geobacter pickeringii]|uniref:Diadenylate cyclase n=1 Tax=Geobacter pickeringii TaxID=345632 RepID=A0A0B5BIT5_9BACT|nr:diadenylate cyclase CdaA [Geobacter pickeringii]AJE03961.1 adenylate cyclase [Geobacter pickeringii]
MAPLIRWQDIADIVIMSFLAYQLYSWFKHTRAMQVLIGMAFLVGVYFVTKNLGLFMTSWILQELGTVLFVLIIVIFQAEIRQALYRFSLLRNLFGRQEGGGEIDLADFSRTIFGLARERTGAIVAFQRQEALDDYLLHGVRLDSLPSSQLLGSIFLNGTPLHDGAVVIKEGRITEASCHLPLSGKAELPRHFGTRHRAGIGLSERSDAAVVIVSEERGEVGLALGGEIERIGTAEELAERLRGLLYPQRQEKVRLPLRQLLFRNLVPKIVTVLAVVASWLVITTKQGGIFTVTVPIKFHNLPANVVLVKSAPEEVEVQLKVFSSLIPSPKQLDIVADLDLSNVREGVNNLAIREGDMKLPLGVVVTTVNPPMARVTVARKVRKPLRVKAKTVGELPGRLRLQKIRVEPGEVLVEGPEYLMTQFDTIRTEEINLGQFRESAVVDAKLVPPSPQLRVLREEPVRVRIVASGR